MLTSLVSCLQTDNSSHFTSLLGEQNTPRAINPPMLMTSPAAGTKPLAELQHLTDFSSTHMSRNSLHCNRWWGKRLSRGNSSLQRFLADPCKLLWRGASAEPAPDPGHPAWGHICSAAPFVTTRDSGTDCTEGHSSNLPHLATAQFIKTHQLNHPMDEGMGILQHCLILCPELSLFPC